MGTIAVSEISSDKEYENFSCGNDSVDELISKSFYPHLLQQQKVFKVLVSEHLVGLYCISFAIVDTSTSDTPLAEEYEKEPKYTALHINYLAIDKQVQRNGIGSTILKYIVREARRLNTNWPIRIITFDALRSLTGWYLERGFEFLNAEDIDKTNPIRAMYFDLASEQQKRAINGYIEERGG